MSMHDFIFSNQRNQRIKRHVLLWVSCYLLMVITTPTRGSGALDLDTDGFLKFYEMVLIRVFVHLLLQMIFCYPLMYFLMPEFFWKKKYLQFICLLLLLLIAVALFRYTVFNYAYNPIMQALKFYTNPVPMGVILSIIQTITGPAYIGFIFISLKFFKDWQQKQEDNFNLQKENFNSELQLLKAQIHPHFLFNTLNNIYSFTLNKSAQAKDIVRKLEDMLHYMIEECEQPLVPVKSEIKIIQDYFDLERIRYGNSLNMQLEITGNYNNKTIAPLLMIPFVENSFKHGTSKILRSPWIKLFIQADENVLHFILTNSKPAGEMVNGKGGIGLSNVKKRLELLYPSGHLLTIESTVNTFTVNMQIPLQQVSEANQFATEKAMII
jgi:sensor histidine kinase YesM